MKKRPTVRALTLNDLAVFRAIACRLGRFLQGASLPDYLVLLTRKAVHHLPHWLNEQGLISGMHQASLRVAQRQIVV